MKKILLALSLLFSLDAISMEAYQTRLTQDPDKVALVDLPIELSMYNTKLALMKCNDDQHDLFHPRSLIQDSLYPSLGKGEIVKHTISGVDFVPQFLITFESDKTGTKIQSWSHKAVINIGGGMYDTTKNIEKLAKDGKSFDCGIINGSRETQKQNNNFGKD